MARLKPLRKDEEIAAIPTSEPVLVELEPGPSSFMAEDHGADDSAPASDEQPDKQDDVDPAVKELKAQLVAKEAAHQLDRDRLVASERERREAIKFANERGELASRSVAERDQSERDFVNSALQGAQSERDSAKASLQAAYTAGDPAAMADAQEKISRAAAKIVNLEGAAAELAHRAEREAANPRQPERQREPERQLSVVDAIDQNPSLLPKEKTWLKLHPELVADTNANAELTVGYQRAVRAGLTRGTDAYFGFLDEFMGYKKAPERSEDDQDEERSIVSAPVSRQAPSMSGGRVNGSQQVHLSPEQRDIARSMGLTDKAYAVQVLNLQRAKGSDPERYPSRR